MSNNPALTSNATKSTISLMEDYFIFDEKELVRIGVVCPGCGTETIFDLTRDQTATNQTKVCSGCNADLLTSFRTEAPSFYNWITYYKRARDVAKDVALRLYFKKPIT